MHYLEALRRKIISRYNVYARARRRLYGYEILISPHQYPDAAVRRRFRRTRRRHGRPGENEFPFNWRTATDSRFR